MGFAFVVIALGGLGIGVGALFILLEHFQKMARIRAQAPSGSGQQVLEAIDAIRKEVAQLRDTSTKYDMSFDAALQRMEARMSHMEQRVNQMENDSEPQRLSAAR